VRSLLTLVEKWGICAMAVLCGSSLLTLSGHKSLLLCGDKMVCRVTGVRRLKVNKCKLNYHNEP